MKRFIYLSAVAVMVLTGCVSRINLDEVDMHAEVKTSIGVPVATVKAKLGQILSFDSISGQTQEVTQLYFKMPGDASMPDDIADYTLFYRDTFSIERSFHTINISSYKGTCDTSLYIAQNLGVTLESFPIPAGTSMTLEFPLVLSYDSINGKLSSERIDSLLIDSASYTAMFTNNFGLTDADIQKIELIYPSNITQIDGTPMPNQALDVHVGKECFIPMYNLAISMKKDPTKPGWETGNSVQAVTFLIRFTLQTSQPLTITQSSHIKYQFDVQYINYIAAWGYFDASKYMHFAEEIDLSKEFDGWNSLRNLKMRLSKPFIKLIATHSIAANMDVNIRSLYAKEEVSEQRQYALFGAGDGDTTMVWHMTNYADPIKSAIGTKASNEISFYYTGHKQGEHEGDLDRLFDLRPNIVGFNIDITTPDGYQSVMRLDKDPYVRVSSIVTVPFVVNEGSELSYADTADLDLSAYSYDSIMSNGEWLDDLKEANAKLYIKASNGIPFAINVDYQFLDANKQPVSMDMISDDGNIGHVLNIPAPTKFNEYGVATEPGTNVVIINVNKDHWKQLQSIRHIRYEVKISGNPTTVAITSDAEVQLSIGIGASVDAIVNTEKFINSDQKEK